MAARLAASGIVADPGRKRRTGFPEVVYGESKSARQLTLAVSAILDREGLVLATRVSPAKAAEVMRALPALRYHAGAECLHAGKPEARLPGSVAVVAAGTSDLRAAEEAALTVRLMGARVKLWADLGVAGVQRLFDKLPAIRRADVVIAVAGMEAALASVLGGLVACPVIGLPTSVGYGTGARGYAALLSMLNTCAPGVTVVNIDNGFGAGFAAGRLLATRARAARPRPSAET